MPDGNNNLLLAMGLDLTPVQQAANTIKSILGALNDLADQVKASGTGAATATGAAMAEIRSNADAAVATGKEAIATTKAQVEAQGAQTVELGKQREIQQGMVTVSAAELAALKEKVTAETTLLGVYEKQLAALKGQLTVQRVQAVHSEATSKGHASPLTKSIAQFGVGVTSGIAGSAAGGLVGSLIDVAGPIALIGVAIETAGEMLGSFFAKLRAVTTEASKLQVLQQVFDGLARGRGVDAVQMMQQLSEATDGLVTKTTLLQTANSALRSPMKLTQQQIVDLAGDVTKLSSAAGNTAEQGMQRMNEAMLRGRPEFLGAILGVQGLRDVLRDIPPGMSTAARETLIWSKTLAAIHDQAEKLGTLPATFDDMVTRIKVASQNVMLAFGQGFGASQGTQAFIRSIDDLVKGAGGLETVFRKAGEAVGWFMTAFNPVIAMVPTALGPMTEALGNILDLATRLSPALMILNAFVTDTGGAFANAHPAISKFGQELLNLETAAAATAAAFSFLVKVVKAGLDNDPLQDAKKITDAWKDYSDEVTAITNEHQKAQRDSQTEGDFAVKKDAITTDTQAQLAAADKVHATKMNNIAAEAKKTHESVQQEAAERKKADEENSRHRQALIDEGRAKLVTAIQETYRQQQANLRADTAANTPGNTLKTKADADAYFAEQEKRQAALRQQYEKDISEANANTFTTQSIPGNQPPPGTSSQEQQREAMAELQAKAAIAKEERANKQEEIRQDEALDDEKYKHGEETLAQHVLTQKGYLDELRKIEETEAKASYDIAIAAADAKFKVLQNAVIRDAEYQTAWVKLLGSFNAAAAAQTLADMKWDDQQTEDELQAHLRLIEGKLKAQQREQERQSEQNKANFAQGETTPQAYVGQQIQAIEATTQAQIEAENQKYDDIKEKTKANKQDHINAINDMIDAADLKMRAALDSLSQLILQYVDKMYAPREGAVTAQIGSLQPGQNPAALQQQMANLLAAQRQQLEQYINLLPVGSDGWNSIYQKIEQVYQTQQKYNDELRKSTDLLQPLAAGLQSISSLIGTIWTSHFVKGLTAGLQGGIDALKNATSAGSTIANSIKPGSTEVPKDPKMQALEAAATSASNSIGSTGKAADQLTLLFDTLAAAIQAAIDKLKGMGGSSDRTPDNTSDDTGYAMLALTGLGDTGSEDNAGAGGQSAADALYAAQHPTLTAGDMSTTDYEGGDLQTPTDPAAKMARFTAGLTAAIGELTNFASALTHSTSAVGGAISGGVAGAGVGQAAGAAMSAKGSPGSIGKEMGPYMAAAGAVVGLITGMIAGQKNAEVSSEMTMMNSQYTSIMDAFHANTDNLQEAIVQMQNLIEEASVDEANSKKGGSQFSSLISQYSEQLSQLQDQQSSIISDMEVQLAIFSAPTGIQSFLTNLQQIIEQYDKFSGAASNAKTLADANSWLTDSLSSYTTQMENTFQQDEESGINDALDLNSLLSERSTLISNLNSNIMGVLEQGVLTRQQTTAQSKGEQIYLMESQASLQLSSINQEISLEQYKVAVETSLYNLAMTSMGLEAQLLSIQENQASQSFAAIQALQQLIQALQSGSYNFGTISSILVSLGLNGGNIPPPPGGNVPNPAGQSASVLSSGGMDDLVAAAYQSRATLGYATFRGQNI